MQHNYVNKKCIYVILPHTYVSIQHYVNEWDNNISIRHCPVVCCYMYNNVLCCHILVHVNMFILHVDINSLYIDISILHVHIMPIRHIIHQRSQSINFEIIYHVGGRIIQPHNPSHGITFHQGGLLFKLKSKPGTLGWWYQEAFAKFWYMLEFNFTKSHLMSV